MKIPASPLLIASLALTSATLAAPAAIKRDNSPSPNPDNGSFESPASRGLVSDAERRDDHQKDSMVDRRRSVMLGHNQSRAPKGHRRAVSLNGKRQYLPSPHALDGAVGVLASGPVGSLVGGNPLVSVGGVAGGVADTANGLIGGLLPGQLGSTVTGVTQPLTGGLVDGLNTGNPLGVVHGALGGVGGAVGGLTQGVSGLLPGQIGGIVSGVTDPLVNGLTSGRPVTGVVNTVNGLLGTVGGILPLGLGDTVTGLTNPLLSNVAGTVDGTISQSGPLQGVIGHDGLVEGLIGGGGSIYAYPGSRVAEAGAQGGGILGGGSGGLLGGILGDKGVVGGLLGGGGGGGGLLGGLLGGGDNGGLLGGLGSGLLGGGGGGLLGGLLGGGNPTQNNFASPTSEQKAAAQNNLLVAAIQQQGGVIRDLGNGQFLTKAGNVVALPPALAGQIQRLLSSVQSQVAGLASVQQLFSAEGIDRHPAVGDALGQAKALDESMTSSNLSPASTSADLPAATGKAPTSAEALDLASVIRQNGQALSDADVLATIQGYNPSNSFISLGDGRENVDLGPLEKILFGTDGVNLFPAPTGSITPVASSLPSSTLSGVPSGIPTSTPVALPSADASAAAADITIMGIPAPAVSAPAVLLDNIPFDDESDEYEYTDDDEEVNVDEYPNFYSGDNAAYASAVNYASAAVPSASSAILPSDVMIPGSVPADIPYGGPIPSSAAMIPQNSAGLA